MLDFGKVYNLGSFNIVKKVRTLSAMQMRELRKESGIQDLIKRDGQRKGVPYICITTSSEDWRIEFACTTQMYLLFETLDLDNDMMRDAFSALLSNMYGDCVLFGDEQYRIDKLNALHGFLNRTANNGAISDEEDAKILLEEREKYELQEKIRKGLIS